MDYITENTELKIQIKKLKEEASEFPLYMAKLSTEIINTLELQHLHTIPLPRHSSELENYEEVQKKISELEKENEFGYGKQ